MCSGEDQQARKLRGGYYTPHPVARFLTSWAIRSCNDSVLEPSCGDGAFVEIASRLLDGGSGTVTAIEIIEAEADKAQKRGGAKANVVAGDAFGWWSAERGKIGQFDAVIGNPPFLAYHYFPSRTREHAFAMMRQEGLNPTKLTNAWSPFVVLSTRALRQGGRLALVLPAELMQVNYAADLRRFLAQRFGVLHMILFRNLVFESVQQEVVLLLGERDDTKPATLWVDEVATAEDLQHLNIDYPPESLPRTTMEPVRDKWTQYLLDRRTSGFLREMQRSVAIPRLGNHGIVGVGVLTGNNDFFAVTKEQAYRAGIDGWCVPLISGARHVPYLVLSEADWRRLYRQNEHVLLLVAEHGSRSALPDPVRRYIADGERAGAHTGYKCQARLPAWWRVPDPWVPDLFMLRHIHDAPRRDCQWRGCHMYRHAAPLSSQPRGGCPLRRRDGDELHDVRLC